MRIFSDKLSAIRVRHASMIALLACALCTLPAMAKATADDAAQTAKKITGGRVMTIERVTEKDHDWWRVKVMTSKGQVRIILIDVETGKPVQEPHAPADH
ncbi:PepSY domain-containing protein [Burkholderiaceae bacterium DAT-1]|nr:PepSY domain-containing protein [Burkholderiaceae bacterium DAT-1]